MVAPRFPLHVVHWPDLPHTPPAAPSSRTTTRPTVRPAPRIARSRDLVPWADPYIALLIRKLQEEVRAERSLQRNGAAEDDDERMEMLDRIDLEAAPPSPDEPLDFPLDFEFPDSPDCNWDDAWPSQPR